MSFTGEFRHTIDAKGRLIVPSRLRDELDEDRVVLVVWPDGCIGLWSGPGWQSLQSELLRQSKSNPDNRSAIRAIASSAHTDQVDRQGRISIPQHLRDHAGIDRDVVVVGVLDHGEIWSPDRWGQESSKVGQGRLDELIGQLDF
jgi:MraZ protein